MASRKVKDGFYIAVFRRQITFDDPHNVYRDHYTYIPLETKKEAEGRVKMYQERGDRVEMIGEVKNNIILSSGQPFHSYNINKA